jgi:Domain of unknown function (DUF397)
MPGSELSWVSASCGNTECVEVARLPDGGMAMRNSGHPGTVLRYTAAEWDAFMDGVRKGEFDRFTMPA